MGNPKPSFQNFFKMFLSPNSTDRSISQETDLTEDVDEPPDLHFIIPDEVVLPPAINGKSSVVKSPPSVERKESLLTRALMSSPEQLSHDRRQFATKPHHPGNISSVSTAELSSDGGFTSPALSSTPSPPLPAQLIVMKHHPALPKTSTDPTESVVEANLGRKRCISFACARKVDRDTKQPQVTEKSRASATIASAITSNQLIMNTTEAPKRKCTLTFACPIRRSEQDRTSLETLQRPSSSRPRPRGSPAPTARKSPNHPLAPIQARTKTGGIHMTGLGDIKPSDETNFHEFASSLDEVENWVALPAQYQGKITLNDCMKKENAIRKLGEEAEAEAIEEEQAEDEAEAEGDEDVDESTVHDFSSDDGNESDNEAGFADSDDENDDGSEYEFWAPSTTTAATSAANSDLFHQPAERRNSNTSIESLSHANDPQDWLPAPPTKGGYTRRGIQIPKMRPGTPDLPDSTDFVCGTLDEDRPLEAAYLSCLEERRRLKHIPIPQDIDPSFPATDPEDNDHDEEEEEEEEEDEDDRNANEKLLEHPPRRSDDEPRRGRSTGQSSRKTTPPISPRRAHSPAPRVHGQYSPKRVKSPAPLTRTSSTATVASNIGKRHLDIPTFRNTPFPRLHYVRTKSLPRTPNPFFISMEKERQENEANSLAASPVATRAISRSRDPHSRGPIDIIQGLERKRQKRKEKYWRQHNRKLAKEQVDRRPPAGKGAERMKELGLEVAERLRAYGTGQEAQLVLSV
jgi:hypothetical protein